MAAFSILIPTYNRKEKLQVVLDHVRTQPGIEQGEVIVGVDGSSDGTMELLTGLSASYPCPLSFFQIPNSGRAVIRNRLLDRASGEILIFIQDDIVVSEKWLESHLQFHRQKQGALVGLVTWYPEATISPYMKWLENGGHLLDFSTVRNGQEWDFWHFYMGNISFPRSFVASLRFEEGIPSYGWEDILYGYEFVSRGGKV